MDWSRPGQSDTENNRPCRFDQHALHSSETDSRLLCYTHVGELPPTSKRNLVSCTGFFEYMVFPFLTNSHSLHPLAKYLLVACCCCCCCCWCCVNHTIRKVVGCMHTNKILTRNAVGVCICKGFPRHWIEYLVNREMSVHFPPTHTHTHTHTQFYTVCSR